MEKNKEIQILLSTYNGEQYLREQLDSFIKQVNFSQVKVLIRDDGSTDGTRLLLDEYRHKYGFDIIYGENVGVNQSMLKLFNNADLNCKYYALSDQDDVWLPNKLQHAVEALEQCGELKPILYASCTCITDDELNPLGISLRPVRGVSFYNAMIENICPGHTQVFNQLMLIELKKNKLKKIFVIDYWIYLIASGIGKVIFDSNYTVLHRQHGKNAVGYQTNFLKRTWLRLKRLNFSTSDPSTLQLVEFYNLYNVQLPKVYSNELDSFINSSRSLKDRINYVFSARVYRQKKLEQIIFKLLYLLKKYHI